MHPAKPESPAQRIRKLILQNCWDEAEELLKQTLPSNLQDPELRACYTWVGLYRARELDIYPIVLELLSTGYSEPTWLREVVLPLRNYFVCIANDPKLTIQTTNKRQDGRTTLLQCAQTLEEWLQRHQVPLPSEPIGTRISLCMIAKDEAEFLEDCLKSVQGIVDEIVLVDTGSTDETVAIAERYGAKVIHSEWRNDFAYARNIALQHATGDWILVLDADERLRNGEAIIEGARHPQFTGYLIEIVNPVDFNDPDRIFLHRYIRMFRRLPILHWEGAIHEQIVSDDPDAKLKFATLEKAQIIHLGYERSIVERKRKAERNIAILESVLKEHSDDWFQLYNLANTLYTEGEYERALPLIERACTLSPTNSDCTPHSWFIWIDSLTNLGKYEEAIAVGHRALEQVSNHPLIHFALAVAYQSEGEPETAYHHLQKVRESAIQIGLLDAQTGNLRVGSGFTGDPTVATYRWHHRMAEVLMALGRFAEAKSHIDAYRAQRPQDPIGLILSGEWFRLQDQREEADTYYQQLSALPEFYETALQLQANLWWEVARYDRAYEAIRQLAHLYPEEEAWWHRWMHCAEQMGNPQAVVEAFEWRAQQGLPVNADMHVNWGRALWQMVQYEQALAHYAQAIQQDPYNTNALLNAGDALYQLGAYHEASNAYATALEHNPLNAQAWFTLGNCYARLGIYEGARLAYQQALQINPLHNDARHNLQVVEEIIRSTAA